MKLIAKCYSLDDPKKSLTFLETIQHCKKDFRCVPILEFFDHAIYLHVHPEKEEYLMQARIPTNIGWEEYLFASNDRTALFQHYLKIIQNDHFEVEELEKVFQKRRLRTLCL